VKWHFETWTGNTDVFRLFVANPNETGVGSPKTAAPLNGIVAASTKPGTLLVGRFEKCFINKIVW
jgi:hypothetical protein